MLPQNIYHRPLHIVFKGTCLLDAGQLGMLRSKHTQVDIDSLLREAIHQGRFKRLSTAVYTRALTKAELDQLMHRAVLWYNGDDVNTAEVVKYLIENQGNVYALNTNLLLEAVKRDKTHTVRALVNNSRANLLCCSDRRAVIDALASCSVSTKNALISARSDVIDLRGYPVMQAQVLKDCDRFQLIALQNLGARAKTTDENGQTAEDVLVARVPDSKLRTEALEWLKHEAAPLED